MHTMNKSKRRLLGAAVGTAGLGMLAGLGYAQTDARVIKIVAKKFVFEPATIQLAKGETVVFELTAIDVAMGFSAPDFKVRGDIMPGKSTSVRLTADKAGSFDFFCDVDCGEGHDDMAGKIVVS
jgi:cytochrome c oxidase subunit II